MQSFKTVDDYIASETGWEKTLTTLRNILLSTDLKEEVKWGGPVYTFNGKNIVGMGAFKSYAGLWFYQGALLKDEKGLLINAQEGVTKALRQMRFQSEDGINEKTILAYVEEAIENLKQGLELKPEKNKPLFIHEDLQAAFIKNPSLKVHFEQLNLTKQREYAEYIATAKREETRQSRLEKVTPMIMAGISLNDKYR